MVSMVVFSLKYLQRYVTLEFPANFKNMEPPSRKKFQTASARYRWAVPAVRSMLLEHGDTLIDISTASATHLGPTTAALQVNKNSF